MAVADRRITPASENVIELVKPLDINSLFSLNGRSVLSALHSHAHTFCRHRCNVSTPCTRLLLQFVHARRRKKHVDYGAARVRNDLFLF